MGNIQANVTKQTLAAYTNVVNDSVVSVFNNAIMRCASGNTMQLTTGMNCQFELINGSLTVTQVAGTDCKFDNKNVTDLIQKFDTELINNTKNFIDNEAQNSQGFFATAFSLQIQDATNSTQVTNLISNSFSGNFTSNCTATNDAFNTSIVNLCGIFNGSQLNFSQNALVTAMTSCVNEVVLKVFTSNSILNELWSKTDQKLFSSQSGIDTILIAIALIIGGIALVGIIIGIVYYVIQSGSKSSQIIVTQQTIPSSSSS